MGDGLFRDDEGRPWEEPGPAHPPPPPPPEDRRGPVPVRRRPEAGLGRYAGTAVIFTLLLLLADAVYVGWRVGGSLEAAAASLSRAAEEGSNGRIEEASVAARDALEQGNAAVAAIRHPAAVVASLVPGLGDDVRAVAALGDASVLAADGAAHALEAATALRVNEGSVGILDGTTVDLEAVEAALDPIGRAEQLVAEASSLADQAAPADIGPVADAVAEARTALADASERVTRANLLLQILPGVGGVRGARHYLLAFQAPSEARATGGLIGSIGIIRAQEGRFELQEVAPIARVFPRGVPKVKAPAWFASNYGPQDALDEIRQLNVSPNFPVVAQLLGDMAAQETAAPIHGVIAIDPVGLGMLLRAVPPIEQEPFGRVDATNAVDVLGRAVYTAFPNEEEQNEFFARLVDSFWASMGKRSADAAELARSISQAASSGHLKVHFTGAEEQAAVSALGVGGDYTSAGRNPQLVFHNNYAANKVDYFLRRRVSTHVRLNQDGSADVTVTVELANEAPDGPPSVLLGPALNGDEPGLNRMALNLLLPEGAVAGPTVTPTGTHEPFTYSDDRAPVVWDIIEIGPGTSQTVKFSYTIPVATTTVGSTRRFELSLVPQATVTPDDYSLVVTANAGYELQTETASGPAIRLQGVLDRPVTFSAEVVPL